jgi:membrane-bound lytic murein transglycosylase B
MGSRARGRRNGTLGSTVAIAALLLVSALAALAVLGRPELPPPVMEGRIPAVAYDAYRSASDAAPSIAAGCVVDWTILAGIAQVESDHGRTAGEHDVTANGDVVPPIRGLPLNGESGTEAVPDTDGGELDGDRTWDRAVGPLQFIPARWRELGRDGNADGVVDPDNIYDAAHTAVAHLCVRSPGTYSDPADLRNALLTYNPSRRYADEVLGWVEVYGSAPIAEVVESAPADSVD